MLFVNHKRIKITHCVLVSNKVLLNSMHQYKRSWAYKKKGLMDWSWSNLLTDSSKAYSSQLRCVGYNSLPVTASTIHYLLHVISSTVQGFLRICVHFYIIINKCKNNIQWENRWDIRNISTKVPAYGDIMDPILEKVEHIPTPTFLQRKQIKFIVSRKQKQDVLIM